jgi:mono/diheme cytochrome c family protein
MPRFLFSRALLVVAAAASFGPLPVAVATADEIDFRRDVAPLLAKRCAGCHDPNEKKGGLDLTTREAALAGGDSGAAIVPGKLDESPAWQRVADSEMPPKNPLPAKEQAILKEWIARGAVWSGPAIDPLQYTSEHRAGYDWWSLQPLGEVTVPPASAWARNPIDAFVEQKLKAAGLAPSPEADARTLVRRLHFDLIGLPPTPEAVDEVASSLPPSLRPSVSPSAAKDRGTERLRDGGKYYEALTDKLLASPAYGERWARHWLDIVRFGESQGFERDKLRTNSWRYRDWVIDAFNRDMAYDRFAALQIAGDVLEPENSDALIATGFLTAGPWDEVGKTQQSAAMKMVVRQDELEDLVGTVGQTFLGLTVNCARCHDHKFDPIRTAEYYALTAALGGVEHGEPTLPKDAIAAQAARLRPPLDARRSELEKELEAIEGPHRRSVLAARKESRKKAEPPKPMAAWEFNRDARDTIGDLHLELKDGPYLRTGALMLEAKGYAASPPLKSELAEKTLEAWVRVDDANQRGGGVLGVQSLDGSKFDAIVYGERQPRRWIAGSNHFRRTQDVGGPEEPKSERFVQMVVAYHNDGTVAVYRDGRPYGKPYKTVGPPAVYSPGDAQVLFGLRHGPTGKNTTPPETSKLFHGAIDKARLYDRALSADEIASLAGIAPDHVDEQELVAAMPAGERGRREAIRFELDQVRQALVRVDEAKVYAVAARKPEPAFVLLRGNPNTPAAAAPPGGIASIKGAVPADFGLTAEASDAERRRKLAEWITDRRNPLFARVIVNRLWHYHFGVGLVDTPNDFGFNGGRPSHPELLDWLAKQLIDHGGSLKHVQRLIVGSATYRQSSRQRPEAAAVDAGNRMLWRKSPMRLDAETLRDALLEFAGKLDRTPAGPGFYEFTTFVRNSQFYDMRDPVGATFERRTIYRTWVRSARSQMLDVFDCPDPSTKAPLRAVTTTPLQALTLLNNSFVLRSAEELAKRAQAETASGDSAMPVQQERQVRQVYRIVFTRDADEAEAEAAGKFVERFGLAAFCRVLLNSNELMYVD